MMEAISQLTQQTAISYSSSLIGKAVTVFDGSSYDTGVVEAVTVSGGECKLLVNGSQYSPDSITDVIDGDVYVKLNSFVGYNVEVKDGDGTVTGKVTGILIKDGNGFVILDNKSAYSMSAITRVITEEDDSSESGSEGESTEDGEGSASVDEIAASYAENSEKEGVVSRSGSSLDDLMKILDGEEVSDSNVISAYASAAVKGALESYSSANVDESAAASGLVSDRIPAPSVYNQYYKQSGNTQSNNVSASSASSGLASDRIPAPSVYNQYYKQTNNTQSNDISASSANSTYDSGDVYGVTNVSDMSAQSSSLEQFHEENVYGTGSITPSTRKYAEDYPLEAAFADEMGTKMADIRFIGNTDINSRIDTSEIICYSEKGRPVTDIGWCGKGILGEVVTYADGTQRVEIIGPTEVSYLYTSGNLTLDEICDQNVVPGSLVGKLTPFETAIRHYAREYSAAEQAEMDRFGEFCARHAYFNNLG